MANPDPPADSHQADAEPGLPSPRIAGRRGWPLVLATFALPIAALVIGSWLGWRATLLHAGSALQDAALIEAEQAARILDAEALLAARIDTVLETLPDQEVRQQAEQLAPRIRAVSRTLPDVAAVVVTGPDGEVLLRVRSDPSQPNAATLDPDWLRGQQTLLPMLQAVPVRATPGAPPALAVARRRGGELSRFEGLILVISARNAFEPAANALAGGDPGRGGGLFDASGEPLALFGEAAAATAGPLLLQGAARDTTAGLIQGTGPVRLLAYHAVRGYLAYAVAARAHASLLREWAAATARWLWLGVPATAGLIVLAILLSRRTRDRDTAREALRREVVRREAAEQELRQGQKMDALGRLTRGIAHDFNNHLTTISSNIELLSRRLPDGAVREARLAESAIQAVHRAARLTHRLLAFAREQPVDPEPVDLGRLVSGMSDLLRRSLGESIAVRLTLPPGLWLTWADANQIESALMRLAANAREAMPEGGTLTIETANARISGPDAPDGEGAAGDYVMLAISHGGSGRPPGTLAEALAPAAAGTPAPLGAMPGLSMIAAFVRQSRGLIRTSADGSGGETVRLYLPRYRPAPPGTATPLSQAEQAGRFGSILVVEDDDALRQSSVQALRDLGYDVLEARDAMEAFRLIADRGGIGLLFTDIGLPGGVNGQALADAAHNVCPGLQVLFTTGYATGTGEVRRENTHLLPKPFTIDELAAAVREALDARAVKPAAS